MTVNTEQILKAILDYSPENIVLMDREYKVISYNRQIRETLYQYHGRYIEIGDDYRDFVVEMAMPYFLEAFGKALRGGITNLELETAGDDFTICFQYRVNPVYAPDGALLGVSLSAEDISERKAAQRKLAESEAKFRALVEQSLVGVFILQEGRFIYVNPAFAGMVAADASQLVDTHAFTDFIHDDDVARIRESCQRVIDGLSDTEQSVLSVIRADGAIRSIELNISRISYNGRLALLGSALDITERIDEEIRISEAVDRGQELERTQIGMELHDSVKQQLVGTILTLQLFQDTLPPQQEARPLLDKSITYLQDAVHEVRQLSHRLAPAVDVDTRLGEKVAEMVARMNVAGTLKVHLDIEDCSGQSDPHLLLVIYRIIQEQFSNILKYAQAGQVHIRIHKEPGNLIVSIADDGIGFDFSKKTIGIGLHNIRRRVQVLGGSVQLQSAPGAGFRLNASLPL
ncbi:MAG: PAS domain-containing sensor histidine kinase [Chitinophagaceae bacterium]|nr:MAG: PAS domain-containing sensor histidine kinase [Chitinophagaceae bacterium]